MKDIKGKVLELEDKVVFTYYRLATLYEGKIVKITLKTILIQGDNHYMPCIIRKTNSRFRIIKI